MRIGSVGLACGVALVLSYLNRQFQLDDALIYQRYLENLLAGNGLVDNLGERFNALTSPLFSYASAALVLVIGRVDAVVMGISSLAMLAMLPTSYAVFARYDADGAAIGYCSLPARRSST